MVEGIDNWKPNGYLDGGYDYVRGKDQTVITLFDTESLAPAAIFDSEETFNLYAKEMRKKMVEVGDKLYRFEAKSGEKAKLTDIYRVDRKNSWSVVLIDIDNENLVHYMPIDNIQKVKAKSSSKYIWLTENNSQMADNIIADSLRFWRDEFIRRAEKLSGWLKALEGQDERTLD